MNTHINRQAFLGVAIILFATLCWLLLMATPAHGQGPVTIPVYGDLTGAAWYYDPICDNAPVSYDAQLAMQLWQGIPWFDSWMYVDTGELHNQFHWTAIRTPADWDTPMPIGHLRQPRLIMFYWLDGPEVYVLIGNEASHTPSGWHPGMFLMISHDELDALRVCQGNMGES